MTRIKAMRRVGRTLFCMVAFGFRRVSTTANSLGTWHGYQPQRESPTAGAVLVALLALNIAGIIAIVAISLVR